MKIYIMHDTKYGNGKLLAEAIGETFSDIHDIKIGDIKIMTPREVVADSPDALIMGAAIRAFLGGPLSKKWLKGLDQELERTQKSISFGGSFLTHILPTKKVQGYKKRMLNKIKKVKNISEVYDECLMGRVVGMEGPFEDDVIGMTEEYAKKFEKWMLEA